MAVNREHNLRVLVSKEERKMVQELADQRGLTVADTVRQLIRESWKKMKENST